MKIIKANNKNEYDFINQIKERGNMVSEEVNIIVNEIIENVKKRKDQALREYTLKLDKVNIENFKVTKEEIKNAVKSAGEEYIKNLKAAKENIEDFHKRQITQSFIATKEDNVFLGQRIRALKRVGIYVPGGTAAYPSSVLMNAIPAKIAGVPEIIMVTPPDINGNINQNILAAAYVAGIDTIYKVGGAQAIAALSYSTESIPKVDKIVGPGNIFVATAKKQVFGIVDIDMIAGPSEILIIADETADPKYLAADLMSQAEHDKLASSILITNSEKIAEDTISQLDLQMKSLSRSEIIKKSLDDFGGIIIAKDIDNAIDLANLIAPEHLEMMTENPMSYLGRLDNAGSIFLGKYSPEPLGDYYAGPNHVLPTGGSARFFSPLSVDSFIKRTSFINYSKKALEKSKDTIISLAESEGLTAHANSIKVRF